MVKSGIVTFTAHYSPLTTHYVQKSSPRLGVAGHALDGRKLFPQRPLDLIDPLMHLGDREGRVDPAMEIDELGAVALAHPHVVHLADRRAFGRDLIAVVRSLAPSGHC